VVWRIIILIRTFNRLLKLRDLQYFIAVVKTTKSNDLTQKYEFSAKLVEAESLDVTSYKGSYPTSPAIDPSKAMERVMNGMDIDIPGSFGITRAGPAGIVFSWGDADSVPRAVCCSLVLCDALSF
jgi:hypothetical protein